MRLSELRPGQALLVLLGVWALVSLPLALFGIPVGHDAINHASYQLNLSRELIDGEIYPRWLKDLNEGAGSPVFFIYPPLAHYVTFALSSIFCWACGIFWKMAIGAAAFHLGSALAFFWVARQWVAAPASLFGALFYMLLPYHLGIDLWSRFAFAEFAAYAITPFVFLSLLLPWGPLARIVALALSYALLVLTHLPTAVIVTVFIALSALVQAARSKSAKAFFPILLGGLLGLALASFYLLPAVMTYELLPNLEVFWSDDLDATQNFLLAGNPRSFIRDVEVSLGLTTVFALAAALYVAVANRTYRALALWLILGLVFCWFMMSPLSIWVWKVAPVLYKIQFPWRFGAFVDLFAAATFALFAAHAVAQGGRFRVGVLLALILIVTSVNLPLVWQGHYLQTPFRSPEYVDRDNLKLERGADAKPLRDPSVIAEGLRPKWFLEQANIEVEVVILDWRSRRIVLDIAAPQALDVTIRQQFSPLWRATLEDGKQIPVKLSRNTGLLRLSVAQGRNLITLTIPLLPSEKAGYLLTPAAGLTVLLLLALAWRRKETFDAADDADRKT